MRRRFFWAMVVVAAVTLLIGGVTAAVLIGKSFEEDRRADFFRQADATGRLLESQVTNDQAPLRRFTQLREILSVARVIGGHDYVEAVVMTAAGPELIPQNATLVPMLPLDVAGLTDQAALTVDVDGQPVTVLARPVGLGGDRRVIVVIGSTTDLVPWSDVIGRFGLALLVGVLLAALLAVWLSRSLARRLGSLAGAARGIADGDLSARAPEGGHDEVASLAVSFNEMAEQLEGAQRRERDFLMSVSHDLRTPLTTIRGYAEGLADDAIAPDDLARVGGVLHAQADRLSRLVEDLMLLSRLEARQFSLKPEPVDLAAHLKEVVEGLRGRADAARVRLGTQTVDVGIVAVDPDRFGQVVANLVENALRYTPEGGAVTVELYRTGEGRVVCSVADTGPGIDPADLPHVFERLYVAQRYRPVRPEGSGLGLNIVKELVDAMGGRLGVDSAPGRGTTVWVEL